TAAGIDPQTRALIALAAIAIFPVILIINAVLAFRHCDAGSQCFLGATGSSNAVIAASSLEGYRQYEKSEQLHDDFATSEMLVRGEVLRLAPGTPVRILESTCCLFALSHSNESIMMRQARVLAGPCFGRAFWFNDAYLRTVDEFLGHPKTAEE